MNVIAFCGFCPGPSAEIGGLALSTDGLLIIILMSAIIFGTVVTWIIMKIKSHYLPYESDNEEDKNSITEDIKEIYNKHQAYLEEKRALTEIKKNSFDKSDAIDIETDIIEDLKALPAPQIENSWNIILNKSQADILREKAWDKIMIMQERINKIQEQQLNTINQ